MNTIVKMNLSLVWSFVSRFNPFAFDFSRPICRTYLGYVLPDYNTVHSLLFLFSSFITLNLFVFDYNQLAVLFFCCVWFLSMQCTGQDKGKLIHEILSGEKRKFYQEEIVNIVQSRYLLANDSADNHQWLNFFLETKWAKSIMKTFQTEIDLIAHSVSVDEKFTLRENEHLFRNWTKLNEFLIDKDTCRFDGLLLKENKPPVLHEIRRGNSIRKDEIVLQLKVQFWIDVIIHDLVKDERKVVDDLEFVGSARLTLAPLLNKYPFIGGFVFYFSSNLIFCFDSYRNLLNLHEDQSKLLKELIHQKVNQILHNQNYKIHRRFIEEIAYHKATAGGPILLCYVHLIEMLNLDSTAWPGNFTYFCLIKVGETIYQTRPVRNAVSPKFNETFTFPIHDLYEVVRIKLYARKHENESSICIGKLKIKLPSRQTASDLESNMDSFFTLNSTFTGKSIWLPFRVKNQANRLPFVNLKIALMHLSSDCSRLVDRTLEQFTRNQPHLPVIVVNALLNNIQLDYLPSKYLVPANKFSKDQIICILAAFNGIYQHGRNFFVRNGATSTGSKIRDAKFCFVDNLFQTAANELSFEILPVAVNGQKETLPGKVIIKLNDLISSRRSSLTKNITFQLHKLSKANPVVIIGTAELYLSVQSILVHQSVLENLLPQTKQDKANEYLQPQNINSISYLSSHSQKRSNGQNEFPEFPEAHDPGDDPGDQTKRAEKETSSSKQLSDQREDDKKDDCEILLAFHYPSDQLLLLDVIRLINVPVFSRDSLPNPTLLIEMWKDKSRVAYSLTETKHQTRDPFYGIQVQFEIGANKLSNLFLRVLVLENAKQTFISKDKQHFLAESFIKIPENILEIGNSSEPKWFKFSKIGIY